MRNFIYLDTDFLASFMAQKNDGLEIIRNIESDTHVRSLNGTPTTAEKQSVNLTGNVALVKSDITMEKSIESGLNINESSELYKEAVSRILHDNVFNYFQNYLENNSEYCVTTPTKNSIGKYINSNGEFEVFNISALENICDQKFLKEIFSLVETIQSISSVSSPVNFKNINQYKVPTEIQNASILCSKVATIFKTIFPVDTVMMMGNMMIIINDKYLREDIRTISFKYSGSVNIIGVINRVYENIDKKSTSPFMEVLNSVSVCGIEIVNALCNKRSEEIYIVTPIAIYF